MKERASADITIYSGDGIEVITVPITSSSKRVVKLMESDYIQLDFMTESAVNIPVGCYVDDGIFGRFYVMTEQMPTYDNTTAGYKYEVTLEAWYRVWNDKVFMLTAQVLETGLTYRKETVWYLTNSLREQMREFMVSLQVLGLVPAYLDFLDGDTDLDKYVDIDTDIVTTYAQALTMSYSATMMLDALKTMADTWECEYWVTGTEDSFVIHFGKCASGIQQDMSLGSNIESMTINNGTDTSGNKLFFFGSKDNIPYSYRKQLVFKVGGLTYDGDKCYTFNALKYENVKDLMISWKDIATYPEDKRSDTIKVYFKNDASQAERVFNAYDEEGLDARIIAAFCEEYGAYKDYTKVIKQTAPAEVKNLVVMCTYTDNETGEKDTIEIHAMSDLQELFDEEGVTVNSVSYVCIDTDGAEVAMTVDDLQCFFQLDWEVVPELIQDSDGNYEMVFNDVLISEPFYDGLTRVDFDDEQLLRAYGGGYMAGRDSLYTLYDKSCISLVPTNDTDDDLHYTPYVGLVGIDTFTVGGDYYLYYRSDFRNKSNYGSRYLGISTLFQDWAFDNFSMKIAAQRLKVRIWFEVGYVPSAIEFNLRVGIIENSYHWATYGGDTGEVQPIREWTEIGNGTNINCNLGTYSIDSSKVAKKGARCYYDVEIGVPQSYTSGSMRTYKSKNCFGIMIFTLSCKALNVEVLDSFSFSIEGVSAELCYDCYLKEDSTGKVLSILYFENDAPRKAAFPEGTVIRLEIDNNYKIPYVYWVNAYDNPTCITSIGDSRLQLPIYKEAEFNKYKRDGWTYEDGYICCDGMAYKDGYIIPKTLIGNDDSKEVKELAVYDDKIYPDGKLLVSSIKVEDKRYKEEVEGEEDVTWNWQQYHLTLKRPDSEFVFDEDFILPNNDSLKIRFLVPEDVKDQVDTDTYATIKQNCRLAGMQFEVEFDDDALYKESGATSYTHHPQDYAIVRNEDFGAKLPNEVLKPTLLDPCVLVNWNVKAVAALGLIAEAEYRLLEKAFAYFKALKDGNFTFTCDMMSDFCFDLFGDYVKLYEGGDKALYDADDKALLAKNGYDVYEIPSLGQNVKIIHDALTSGYNETRIIGMELKLDKPYDTPRLICGETDAYSRIKQLEKEITKLNK